MTPQEINEAVARELGWTNDGSVDPFTGIRWPDWRNANGEAQNVMRPPNYCHDIKAASEIPTRYRVVDGNSFYLEWIEAEGVWRAGWRYFDTTTGWNGPANGHNADPAMAICLAFLKLRGRG